jgi:glycine dehydrogenase subunit 1
VADHLLEDNILAGYPLGADYPGLEDCLLVAVTEMNSADDIDWLCAALEEVSNG